MPGLLEQAYMQRAVLEILLLAVPAGVLGTWIVLRGLAFFTHAIGTAAFPGLVLAGPLGLAPQLCALVTGLGLAGGVQALSRRRAGDVSAATGMLLVAALAVGVILASDVLGAGSGVDRLLFGSLLTIDSLDLALTALVAAGALVLDFLLGRQWLADALAPAFARSAGIAGRWADWALLAGIAGAVVVALDSVGALLVTALMVGPAATARLLDLPLAAMRATAVGIAALEGLLALAIANTLNVGPGATLAVLAGAGVLVAGLVTRRRA